MVSPTTSSTSLTSISHTPLVGSLSQTPKLSDNAALNRDIESRSNVLSKIISRQFPLADSDRKAFRNPISTELSDESYKNVVNLLSEVINPSFLDQITGANKRFELHAKFLRGLAYCFDRVPGQVEASNQSKIEPLLLYSLMPIYLASSREKIVPAVESTLRKLRWSFCLALCFRVLDIEAGYTWLEAQTKSSTDLDVAMENKLRVSVPTIVQQYWSDPSVNLQTTETDRGLWNLTCQLLRGDSQIHIPKSLSLGVVSWERIMEHWNALNNARIQLADNCLKKNREGDFNSIARPVEAYLPQTGAWELLLPARSEVPPLAKDSRKIISESTSSPETETRDRRLVEIRSSSDPQLKKVLEQLLQKSREEQTRLTMAVVSRIMSTPDKIVNWFSPMIDQIIEQSEVEDLKGFATDAGELALMFYDVDRSDIAYWLRESFSKLRSSSFQNSLHSEASEQLIAGVAMVNAPSRSFEIEQLIDAAWRCRDGAAIQGANAVKTIEVY